MRERGTVLNRGQEPMPEGKTKEYDKVPRSLEELGPDPLVRHFDLKNLKTKEIAIFMEESKIWQDLLSDCIERSGVNASLACKELNELVQERVQYYNSRFNPAQRPKKTPGIPKEFEPASLE